MKKSGMTMLMLVIYITVLLILAGISISSILNTQKLSEVKEDVYKATIKQYIEEFNSTKEYNEFKGTNIPNRLIEGVELLEYIPSINSEHTKYILIENGDIKYNKSAVQSEYEQQYLEELEEEGLIEEYTP